MTDILPYALAGLLTDEPPAVLTGNTTLKKFLVSNLQTLLKRRDLVLCKQYNNTYTDRYEGRVWSPNALTMIGIPRLLNLREVIETIEKEHITGEIIECGVWRGGACIYMRLVLNELGSDRTVILADSFDGLPGPSHPNDAGDKHHTFDILKVPVAQVRENFSRCGIDGGYTILKGWFSDTLPAFNQKLSVLRIDCDMYQSTSECLRFLYPNLSEGGFSIVDDYWALNGCRLAVDDYRERNGITTPLIRIDWSGVYWRK
jgi:O-methyltransferase